MAEFTVICEDGRQEIMHGASMEEVMQILDKQGTEYLEIIEGSQQLSTIDLKKIKKDPIRFMAETALKNAPVAQSTNANTNVFKDEIVQQVNIPANQPVQQIPKEDVFFEENGVKFKISKGMLYKKDWQTLPEEEYRIINKKSKKEYNGDQYEVQIYDWFEVVRIPGS